VDREGVELYDDAVEQLDRWRSQGLPLAVVTSSRNGAMILSVAGLTDQFDARLDGNDISRLGFQGKPAPDMFLEAARQLDVAPAGAMLVEDAVAGVQAGRRGGFGLVVGVDRGSQADTLFDAGADIVVQDLRELADRTTGVRATDRRDSMRPPPSALNRADEIIERLRKTTPALFLDYDGTLTPIVERPEDARLSPEMKNLLSTLASRFQVAVVSGRDLHDVRHMVGLDQLVYAGSHGFDILGPNGLRMQHEDAKAALPALDAAENKLAKLLSGIDGVRIERKGFAVAVHYRQAAEADTGRIERIVDQVQAEQGELRKKGGKKIFELQPDVPWDKGRAVHYLMEALDLADNNVLPIYFGDDTTDEDAFRALSGRGLGIRCGPPDEPTAADYLLDDVGEVEQFLGILLDRLDPT
jgi:trehalose 6-phosphate phosphatase